jgi:hypothetical protein
MRQSFVLNAKFCHLLENAAQDLSGTLKIRTACNSNKTKDCTQL